MLHRFRQYLYENPERFVNMGIAAATVLAYSDTKNIYLASMTFSVCTILYEIFLQNYHDEIKELISRLEKKWK